ncbi:hypothetical protein HCC60_07855 [Streptococcus suis]|nr:hypothetical protein [Streptococcus suis]
MAFTPKKKEIAEAISQSVPSSTQEQPAEIHLGGFERKKQYQFTLKPSNRERLRQASQDRGFRSDSAFLDYLIENL